MKSNTQASSIVQFTSKSHKCENCIEVLVVVIVNKLEMWANAQRDGRPAEYRWRPLFDAAKFGWRSRTWLPCSNAAKTRKPLKFAGVPQTGKPISAASGPKFTILWGHVEDIFLLNIFSDCRYVPSLRRYCPTKLCNGAQMANFWRFFGSCISSEPCAAHFETCILNSR